MNNVGIEGISNLNVVTEMFSQVGCVEADNCILVLTNRDFGAVSEAGDIMTANAAIAGTRRGGAVGGIVAGAVVGAINASVNEKVGDFHRSLDYKKKIAFNTGTYAGFLINVLSTGVGVIPLKNSGQIIPKVKDLIISAFSAMMRLRRRVLRSCRCIFLQCSLQCVLRIQEN